MHLIAEIVTQDLELPFTLNTKPLHSVSPNPTHHQMIIHYALHRFLAYRKTPHKRPWAFASFMGMKRAFPASSSLLWNENRIIFGRDIVRNVKKRPIIFIWSVRRGVYLKGAFIGCFYGIQLTCQPAPILALRSATRSTHVLSSYITLT